MASELFTAPPAMREPRLYPELLAEVEHLNFWISSYGERIQAFRETTPEWTEMDKVSSRISDLYKKRNELLDRDEPNEVMIDKIQDWIKVAREYSRTLSAQIEDKVRETREHQALIGLMVELTRVKDELWRGFNVSVD